MLPEWPKEVTTLTNIKVNKLSERSQESYVKHLLQLPVVDPRYQRDQYGTKCNFYVRDCLRVLGYELPPMLANDMVKEFSQSRHGFQPSSLLEAINNANQGRPTVAGRRDMPHGHVVMVLPHPEFNGHREDVLVAQAGAINFYGRQLTYSWPRHMLKYVEFFTAP